jgi:rhodanese-related sulfurtransferase
MSAARSISAESLSYAGDVAPEAAFAALVGNASAQLVDVRTAPEWALVGRPDLASIGKAVHSISWKLYPAFDLNPQFIAQLQAAVPNRQSPLYFLCKTGGRSLDAAIAATAAGYTACYNIAGGMEGDMNALRQRGQTTGWKAAKLPWEQA